MQSLIDTSGIVGNYRIVTSGDLLHHVLKTTLADKKIYHLGRNREHAILHNTNAQLTHDLRNADAIILSCFVENNENHDLFNQDLLNIILSGKPVYCPNPDQIALEKDFLRYPSGYFARKLENMGGKVYYLGKPYPIIYDFVELQYPHISITKETTLMIGDTLETDIAGAISKGIDSLLVLTGITALFQKNNPLIIKQSTYQPTYITTELV